MQLLLDLARPAAPTLDNFEPGGNAEVLSVLRAWLGGALPEGCVYLWGPRGSGRTHLLRAVLAGAAARGCPVLYQAAGASSPPQSNPPQPTRAPEMMLTAQMMAAQWLAVDDVQALDADGESALFTSLNRAAAGELRLLLSGDNAPSGLRLRPDVRTRVGAALVLQVKPLSDDEKAQALRRHAHTRGFDLGAEGAEYLLRYGRRDLPSLMALLDAADRYSLQTQRAVTLPLLREVLQLADSGT